MKKKITIATVATAGTVMLIGAAAASLQWKIPTDAPKDCCFYQKAKARGGVEWQVFEAKKALEQSEQTQ